MNRITLVFAACLALAAPAFANVAAPLPTVVDAAQETVMAFLENFNAGNVEGLASTYSDSGSFAWVENSGVTNTSKAEAVANGIPNGARIEADPALRVIPAGDRAAVGIVPFTFFMKDDKGAETALFKGVMTLTIAADPDGVFRIVAGHMSSAGRD